MTSNKIWKKYMWSLVIWKLNILLLDKRVIRWFPNCHCTVEMLFIMAISTMPRGLMVIYFRYFTLWSYSKTHGEIIRKSTMSMTNPMLSTYSGQQFDSCNKLSRPWASQTCHCRINKGVSYTINDGPMPCKCHLLLCFQRFKCLLAGK